VADQLKDRVAVITGGTGALGRGVVRVFAAAGARVHVPWVAESERDAMEAEIRRGVIEGTVTLYRADVTDADSVGALFARIREAEGRLDILVNGVGGFAMAPLEEARPDLWTRMMVLNATSAYLCTRSAVEVMGEGPGRIINVAAMPAVGRGAPRMSAYSASKAAVLNLTLSLSQELRERGITVNAVVPTTIDTPANREAMPENDRSTWLLPEEIGRVMCFLASDDAAIVTGAALTLGRG
jgi:NAD(P)-dependent dehydrogenase (short-subunit alcohol dehydrogenase family)